MDNHQVLIRRAVQADAAAVAEVWIRSFDAALPTVRRPRDDDRIRDWFVHNVVPTRETWVAEARDAVVGVMVLHNGELDQLYLDPDWRGRGIGDRLIAVAKERCPGGLELWTFQVNTPAQRFYERHGFVESFRTDGSENEEREPDIRYVWKP
ncbi:GNAT family N-acetyltransferase [Nocardia pseudobrasiliensis]|uniref:N-acetylglutamate synthase-like GNAT family acetyltransferase n=1 Tax=Nocardia pseudobrasiliensis TaxID=45979 RepID=A0A370ICP1_9NOCA|nr:GNAT family N-acetyltransferase [Nocardia pseudobrasiliensis]RDI68492.1 N-acetylglutamate synthase-like GNAT family acetyltransferase [Nocardia pseudobrasiliensis]